MNKYIKSTQYKNSANLDVRIALHELYSTNKYGWGKWVFDQFDFPDNAKILELGCGTGGLWQENKLKINPSWRIILSDISNGMVEKAKETLDGIHCFDFSVFDSVNIPFDAEQFDSIVANHMLYHVADIDKTLYEINRVLNKNGVLFASTPGRDNMKEMHKLLFEFDERIVPPNIIVHSFNLENGQDMIARHFKTVEIRKYEDSLFVTEAAPLIAYILSLKGFGNASEVIETRGIPEFEAFVENKVKISGGISIKKDCGLFVAKKI